MTGKLQSATSDQPRSRGLGARQVVDLLQRNLDDKLPDVLVLTEGRQRDQLLQLLTSLTALQRQIVKSPYVSAGIKTLLVKHLDNHQTTLSLSRPDYGALNLVDQVFDELLASGKFDAEAWRLLVKLRVPIAKYALQDFAFFFAAQNAGRRLLNAMTLNLMGSGNKFQDSFRAELAGFVEQINAQYCEDVAVFNRICIQAQTWFAAQQQRLDSIQTKLAEVSSDKQKRSQAEPRVVELLNRVAGGRELPSIMVDFLFGDWHAALRILSMREGDQSPDWKRAVRTTESMVELVDACQTPEGQQQYLRFLPALMKSIRGPMQAVANDADALEGILDPIELILNALVRGAQPDSRTAPALAMPHQEKRSYEVIPGILPADLVPLDALQVGDWLRIKTPDGAFETCRLTLKPENPEEAWVLVNHNGKKIAKKTRHQLAKGLRDGVVEIVGQGRWIDDLLKARFMALNNLPRPTKPPSEPVQGNKKPTQWKGSAGDAVGSDENVTDSSDAALAEPDSLPQTAPETAPPTNDPDRHETPAVTVKPDPESVAAEAETPKVETLPEPVVEPEPTDTLVSDDASDTDAGPDWEDFVTEPRQLSEQELEAASTAVNQLNVGGWVVLTDAAGTESRCKLAVRIKATDKFIFVNRLGIKVWEAQFEELVRAVALGEVTIQDTGAQFDSALERVVKTIQSEKKLS